MQAKRRTKRSGQRTKCGVRPAGARMGRTRIALARCVADGTSPSRNGAKKIKPNKHSDTKIQVQLVSNQLLKRPASFSREAMAIADKVPSIRETTKGGRRKVDGEQLAVQVDGLLI